MAQGHSVGGSQSAAIEQDIGRTRAEIGLTLDALQHQLAARSLFEKGINLLDKGINMITKLTGDGGGLSVAFEGVRANPIAIALIGAGIAWLAVANTGVLDTVAQDERVRAARRRLADMTGIGGMAGSEPPSGQAPAFNPAIGTAERDHTGGWVHQATDAARGAIRAVRDTAGEYTGRPAGWLRQAGDYAGMSSFGGGVSGALGRHPLLVGAAGLCAGALIASLLPTSEVEDAWISRSRDQMMKRASEIGRETVNRVRQSLDQAADEAFSGDDGAR
jgi:hypothetical protein